MRVFISYHRADTEYRHKTENILNEHNIDYYAVPEDADFNGKTAESIKTFICNRLKQCDTLLCLIGQETGSRPHVDHEIHTALKGNVGKRLGIIGVHLPTRKDTLQTIELNTFPTKLWYNKDYVVWTNWSNLNCNIIKLLEDASSNRHNNKIQTKHTNPCMPLLSKKYYDN